MLRTAVIRISIILAVFMPLAAFAEAYDDLMKVQAAFKNASSWHADEQFSNGRTVTVEYSAPDRWRIQSKPDITEMVIGNDVYMLHNGHATKLPFGGGMIRQIIQDAGFSVKDDIRQSARDLGMQTLDGQSVHVYSYTARDVPVTIYVGANSLPVQSVVQDKKLTTTIKYSKYNEPISIEPQ
jgi:hypothetical protein